MDFGIATVASICALCYLAGMTVKASNLNDKWIPIICCAFGVVLGILALYTGVPNFPATDPLTAAAVGATSGWAATGIDQSFKQLTKK